MSENSEKFYCPICRNAMVIENNPRFCSNCGYEFPKDQNNHIIVNNTQVASRANIHEQKQAQQKLLQRRFKKGTDRWKFWPGFVLPVLSIIVMGVLQGILIFIIPGLTLSNILTDPVAQFVTTSVSILFFFIPTLWIQIYYPGKLSFKQRLDELDFPLDKYKNGHLVREILLGFLIGILMLFLVTFLQFIGSYLIQWIFGVDINSILESDQYSQFQLIVPENILQLILFVLMMLLFVGVPEELMFRGFVQRSFSTKLSKGAAILLTAIFFSLFHIYFLILQPPIFIFMLINYLGVSLVLGVVKYWRGDIYACSAAHIMYNSLQTIFIYIILN